MAGPYPAAREGAHVDKRTSGFPMFFRTRRTRVITADPLALMEHIVATEVPSARKAEALAYVEQASDFWFVPGIGAG